MSDSKLVSRARKSSAAAVDQGQTTADFNSNGVAPRTAESSKLLSQFPDIYELGRIAVYEYEAFAGNAAAKVSTVPTGKFWRLLGVVAQVTADANAANRIVTVITRDASDTAIETFTQTAVTANTTGRTTVLFAPNADLEGNRGVAAAGTLTLPTIPSANDTFTIGSKVYTFVASDNGTVTNAIELGANVAATQANIVAKLNAVDPLVTAGNFAANVSTLTARQKGTAGNSIATTQTITPADGVFNAATLGTTTAGVNFAEKVSALSYPASGTILPAGFDVAISVANGLAGDVASAWLVVLEFDADPR